MANPTRVDKSILDCESAELFRAAIKSRFTRAGAQWKGLPDGYE